KKRGDVLRVTRSCKLTVPGHDNDWPLVRREIDLVTQMIAESEIVRRVRPRTGRAGYGDKRHEGLHAWLIEEGVSIVITSVDGAVVGDRHDDRAIQPNGEPCFQAFDDQRFPSELPRRDLYPHHDDDRQEGSKRQSTGHYVHGRSKLK